MLSRRPLFPRLVDGVARSVDADGDWATVGADFSDPAVAGSGGLTLAFAHASSRQQDQAFASGEGFAFERKIKVRNAAGLIDVRLVAIGDGVYEVGYIDRDREGFAYLFLEQLRTAGKVVLLEDGRDYDEVGNLIDKPKRTPVFARDDSRAARSKGVEAGQRRTPKSVTVKLRAIDYGDQRRFERGGQAFDVSAVSIAKGWATVTGIRELG